MEWEQGRKHWGSNGDAENLTTAEPARGGRDRRRQTFRSTHKRNEQQHVERHEVPGALNADMSKHARTGWAQRQYVEQHKDEVAPNIGGLTHARAR